MNVCAIDPGKSGGIAFYSGGEWAAYALPYEGSEIDHLEIARLIREHSPDVCVCEEPILVYDAKKKQFRNANAKISFLNYGRLKQLFIDRGVSWEQVRPSAWTKGVPKEKADRIRVAREKHPTLEIKGDGQADALLILHWWRKSL